MLQSIPGNNTALVRGNDDMCTVRSESKRLALIRAAPYPTLLRCVAWRVAPVTCDVTSVTASEAAAAASTMLEKDFENILACVLSLRVED